MSDAAIGGEIVQPSMNRDFGSGPQHTIFETRVGRTFNWSRLQRRDDRLCSVLSMDSNNV